MKTKWFEITRHYTDINRDAEARLFIRLFYLEIVIFYGAVGSYAGWIDYKDHSKGIRRASTGINFEIEMQWCKEKIVYPRGEA